MENFVDTSKGNIARWSAVVAVSAIAVSIALNALVTGLPSIMRLLIGVVFLVGGVSAFVTSLIAVKNGDRRASVWAAMFVGALATALLIAEFTVME